MADPKAPRNAPAAISISPPHVLHKGSTGASYTFNRKANTEGRGAEMRPNRKSIAVGLTLGALAGGAGVALAASGTSTSPTPTPLYGVGSRYIGAGFHAGAMRGVMLGQGAPIAGAASYLGLSETQLQTQLQSGKTLAQIAKAQGKSVSGLESAMIEAITTNIDANSALSSSQKTSILAQMKVRLGTMVNTTCPRVSGAARAGGFGPMMMRG